MWNERRRITVGALAGVAVLGMLAVAALPDDREDGDGAEATRPAVAVSSPSGVETSPAPTAGSGPPVWEGPTPPPVDMRLAMGSAQAPVTIVEFGDFRCPKCRTFAQDIAPVLRRKYVEPGVVRMFWRDYPIRGRASEAAAVAARAASRQGRFWEFHDVLYSGEVRLDGDGLREAARRAGLDVGRFDADRRDKAVREAVAMDMEFALRLGMPGTPAFLINGELLFGAQPVAAFEKAIEKARRER
ncbi:DsbA family protein [Nonomuraea sp. SYSU D8015]|uniref:DsbA family protein n=1 Tax=Nonomuraea sp. SYSU D8015 TaxID=2593644 RepID=UPI0016614714|nr:thioredoxin domain-containing protein [Nonomuraea sp. SYSU D8015]